MIQECDTGATISEDGVHRYLLWRIWDVAKPPFVVIGLNPSTADATKDDPTIRRCIGFAKREGAGRLLMLNLFAYRVTDPRGLHAVVPILALGKENALTIETTCRVTLAAGGKIVAAWGRGTWGSQDHKVVRLIRDLGGDPLALGFTEQGHPRHPLYVRADAPLVRLAESPLHGYQITWE
jgi:hypothetical protein